MIGRPRSVGLKGQARKTELHHWWPKGLSKLWADTDGKVVRRAWNGDERRIPPAQLGAITNGHLMKFGGPWTTTIEPLFNDADTNLPRMVERLQMLPHGAATAGMSFDNRFTAHDFDRHERSLLGEGLASLLVRCPAHRNLLHLTVQRINGRFGAQLQTKHDDSLIAGNIHQHYSQIVTSMQSGGKVVLLRSGDSEFVMGEGYLNTLVGHTVQLQYRCLLPLTPNLAVQQFLAQCTLVVLRLVGIARLQFRHHEIDEGFERFRRHQAEQVEAVDISGIGPAD